MTLLSIDFDHGPPLHVTCIEDAEAWLAAEELASSLVSDYRRRVPHVERDVVRALAEVVAARLILASSDGYN